MESRHARSGHGLFAATFVMLLLTAAFYGCAPMEPSGGRELRGIVGFKLDGSSMQLLESQSPAFLRIRVFKVEGGQPTAQEGNDNEFPIDMSGGTYQVAGVTLGMKEFQLAILNQARETLGEGKIQVLVKPGAQAAPSVTITVNTGPRRRDVPMNLFVELDKPGETPKVTYRDVKATIDAKCVSCHAPGPGARQPDGGLDLSDFPFAFAPAGGATMTQEQIIAEMVLWAREPNPAYRMPPGPAPAVPADDINRIEQWKNDGMLKFPMSDELGDLAQKIRVEWTLVGTTESGAFDLTRTAATEPFAGACKDLVIGAAYDYRLTVLGMGDEVVFTESHAGEIIGADGTMDHVIKIPYTDPTVTIPVVVQ